MEVFEGVLEASPGVQAAALADVVAVRERDPACGSHAAALLYYKGYAAVQVHRIAHALWASGGRVMARALQSRVSEVFAVDIHPAASIGPGFLLDHGTGVVIGETAVVGRNVSMLQNVTLGGTGKDAGDRHPKVGDNVLIGAGATVLGDITIGRGAQVAAGSLVLRAVRPRTMVAGSPAAEVGRVRGNPALDMRQWAAGLEAKAPSWEASMCAGGGGEGVAAAVVAAEAEAPPPPPPPAPPPPPPPARPVEGTGGAEYMI
jgi:serine O-acetyltransferase